MTPGIGTVGVWISITNSTCTRCSRTVSACRKSQARVPCAGWPETAVRSVTPAGVPARGRRRPGSGGWFPLPPGIQGQLAHPGCAGTPARVLPCRLLRQRPHLRRDRRPAWRARTGPFLLDHAPVPRQQSARGHDLVRPQARGQQPRQGGEHGAVGPAWPRARGLPPGRAGPAAGARPAAARPRPRAAARGSPRP